MYDIHPFQRPFNDELKVIKPYDMTGPFEDQCDITYTWRVQDILNAVIHAGIQLRQIEEFVDEIDYEWPFFLSCEEVVDGVRASKEEVERMYDWTQNPAIALHTWISFVGKK